jgi:phosphoribosyl 1,2-cyclic phosphodiesterase
MTVRWEFTHHPGAALGFRVEAEGRAIAVLCDNEFLKGYLGRPGAAIGDRERLAPYSKIVEFATGAAILIGEAQYTNAEYPGKIGWGHSSVSNACVLAHLAGVRRWIVVHHDPMHDDEFLQEKLLETRRILEEVGGALEVINGFDGMIGGV